MDGWLFARRPEKTAELANEERFHENALTERLLGKPLFGWAERLIRYYLYLQPLLFSEGPDTLRSEAALDSSTSNSTDRMASAKETWFAELAMRCAYDDPYSRLACVTMNMKTSLP